MRAGNNRERQRQAVEDVIIKRIDRRRGVKPAPRPRSLKVTIRELWLYKQAVLSKAL